MSEAAKSVGDAGAVMPTKGVPAPPSIPVSESRFADPAVLLKELQQLPVFATLRPDQMHCFTQARYRKVPEGFVVMQQGEAEREYTVIVEGGVRIYQTQPDGREVTVVKVDGAQSFGEISILTNLPNAATVITTVPTEMVTLDENGFWQLVMTCPMVRQAILGAMAWRTQRLQEFTLQQEKLASLGTLAAGLMHELNNPGAAAKRAASQLRENLTRMQDLSLRFCERDLSPPQKACIMDLQRHAIEKHEPAQMNSLEQSDAEEALSAWLEENKIENAWKMGPTFVGIALKKEDLACARAEFPDDLFSDTLNWLEALVGSLQLVGTIEESVGRVTELVHAVKSYAYEGKGQKQSVSVNDSIRSTMVILAHKFREKEVELVKEFAPDLPPVKTAGTGLNQVWTNLLDNALDAIPRKGHIRVKTWEEGPDVCISIKDDGEGIPQECQAHIFEPFYTTKEVGVGTGLGLDIAHRIVVQQYAGNIHFTSRPGETEFFIRLPKERP